MSSTVQANDGAMLPLDSIPSQLVFSGNFISTITVIYQSNTYVQTYLNDGTNIVYISGWVNSNAPVGQQIMVDQSSNIMVDQNGQYIVT